MLEYGIIEPAASPWASNVVLVKKKDGSLRFCVDYRRLNSITYKDSYPLPLIDNCLNALSGSLWYSTLDLRSGYYNIPIAESDRDKSAFITRQGCFRFTVMPFGLTCAPSVFQRLMDLSSVSNLPRRYHRLRKDLRRTAGTTGRSLQSPEGRQLEAQTFKVLPLSTKRGVSGARCVRRRSCYATE